MLKLGVAKKNITPPLNVPHVGWGAQAHVFASGVESEFWATALVLCDGKSTAVILDVDTSHLLFHQAEKIRQATAKRLQIQLSSVRLSTTHTHSGPMIWSQYYPDSEEAIQQYVAHMENQIVEAAAEAFKDLRPVAFSSGYGTCNAGTNRRQSLPDGRTVVGYNEQGPSDPTVGVVRFEDESGAVMASIAHYACHPTVLGYANQLHSTEYPGFVKRFVEQWVGGTCLFLQGATGNVGPGPEGFTDDVQAMKTIGTVLGCEATKRLLELRNEHNVFEYDRVVESGAPLGIWKKIRQFHRDPVFRVESRKIAMPLREQLPVDEAKRIAYGYQKELQRLQQAQAPIEQIKEVTYKAKRAFFALERSEQYYGKSHMDVEAHFIQIGDTVLIGVPLEPFVQIAIAIRERSPFACTLFSGYTNGWLGYLPTASDFPYGGYEVDTTPYGEHAAETLIHSVTAILEELKQSGSNQKPL